MMIELTKIKINNHDDIIIARNKVYHLVFDLNSSTEQATEYAIKASEILQSLLAKKLSTEIRFIFTKKSGYYSINICIACSEDVFHSLRKISVLSDVSYSEIVNYDKDIVLSMRVSDPKFIPNQKFLELERERLIQNSTGEMLQEIKNKNIELSRALQELRASSTVIQAEKMRALGAMTAGVAHELNNPMMGILNFVQYAIKHTDEQNRCYQPLLDAEHEIERCQDIITNLLTFSRTKKEGEEDFAPEKLSVLCERILQLETYKLSSLNIAVNKDFEKDEPQIPIKANKIQQVILNLVTNAIDAMRHSEKRELQIKIYSQGESLCLSIKDTGTGIDEETQDKIYEPFFTSKETGQGTGLGLSVTKSIVEEHGGKLILESHLGKGTKFTLVLSKYLEAQNKDEYI